jgi:hypothetical protein
MSLRYYRGVSDATHCIRLLDLAAREPVFDVTPPSADVAVHHCMLVGRHDWLGTYESGGRKDRQVVHWEDQGLGKEVRVQRREAGMLR